MTEITDEELGYLESKTNQWTSDSDFRTAKIVLKIAKIVKELQG